MALRLFKVISSAIIGFGIGYTAVYLAENINISPLIVILPAAALCLIWGNFISKVEF